MQKSASLPIRLSLMMFFQYLLFAVWWVPLAAYLTNMGIEGFQKALILSSMAIGCLGSPFVGLIADRFFPGEKVLVTLNFSTSILLFWAAKQTNADILFILLLAAMICQMPTWSLSSAIAMAHLPAEKFPRIRVFGSIGWVASGLFSLIAVGYYQVDFDGTNLPLYCGAATSLFAALSNFTLPSTPPPAKGESISAIDVLGLRTLSLAKDKNFAFFLIGSFLAVIPFSMYWSYCSEFLLDKGFQYITVTMNWGQLAEMFFLVIVPVVIAKAGLRKALYIGLATLVVRCLAFYFGSMFNMEWLYFVGILTHGIIFGFFFLGGQIYIDKRAPKELKAQAQGFIFLVTFGVGLLAGNFINAYLIDLNSMTSVEDTVYIWDNIWGVTSVCSIIVLAGFMIFFRDNSYEVIPLENESAEIENTVIPASESV